MTGYVNNVRHLFYLLIFLVPVQLGRHFFFDFSLIAGVRSDYLAPTFYLTDGIALLIIVLWIILSIKNAKFLVTNDQSNSNKIGKDSSLIGYRVVVVGALCVSYLLFSSLFFAPNTWGALYRTARLVEGMLLTYVAIQIQPRWKPLSLALSGAVAWVSGIAIVQYVLQRSLGGWGWFVGERTFSVSTPGIATLAVGGEKILRAYGTFPHPNVLGGFLAIALIVIAFRIRALRHTSHFFLLVWYSSTWLLGAVALGYTGSRTAWIVAAVGVVMMGRWGVRMRHWVQTSGMWKVGLVASIIFSSITPLLWSVTDQSLQERTRLTRHAWESVLLSPLVGIGVNNVFPPSAPFQPVHNVFLLWWAETGIIGITILGWCLYRLFQKNTQTPLLGYIVMVQWLGLSLFDHYLLTLPQGLLLTMVVISLVFLPQTSYTD